MHIIKVKFLKHQKNEKLKLMKKIKKWSIK